ncbi:MAG: tetratricopeptide repeat protein, partial [bacterium]
MQKRKQKNKKLERIIKLITGGKLDEALELADANDAEDLIGIGVLFGQNEVHNIAERIFDRVIRLNPNLAEAWSNKGIALGNLGKYDEEIKCYDEAIKINPNYDKAWSNKGIALGNLGKYDESIKCYDEAIKINPNLAEAYGNLGIALLNLHKYDSAVIRLRKAKELFSTRGLKKEADKAYKYEVLAQNSSKLMSKLEPLDKEFLSLPTTESLIKLKGKSWRISKSIENIYKEFEKKEIPEDAIRLLIGKTICYTALTKALQFEIVDLKELRETQDVFKEWNLPTLAMAVDCLIVFIHGIDKCRSYGEISKIPREVENYLLRLLEAVYVLDGTLTNVILDEIKGEPYLAKPAGVEKAVEIKTIPIPNFGKNRLRVCVVQLDYSLTGTFPYQLENKEAVKEKILKALGVAKKKAVDIILKSASSGVKRGEGGEKEGYFDKFGRELRIR